MLTFFSWVSLLKERLGLLSFAVIWKKFNEESHFLKRLTRWNFQIAACVTESRKNRLNKVLSVCVCVLF